MTKHEAIEILKGDFSKVILGENESHSDAFTKAFNMAIKALESQIWIPCNKEMPTEKGYYQTTVFRNGNVGYEVFDLWWQDGMWFVDEGKEMFIHAVVAWMPLPKPYSEEVK